MPTLTEAEFEELLRRSPQLKVHGQPGPSSAPPVPPPEALTREDFDSELEYRYYRKRIQPAMLTGQITALELHKSFEIAPAVTYAGRTHKARVYTPDFVLTWRDGSVEVVETKHSRIKKNQRDYGLRRHLFLHLHVVPNGWRFFEVDENDV